MYVLTKGWYSDWKICGVVDDEQSARGWYELGEERGYYGPFEPGEVDDSE
jgi:hypothetical protein